MASVHKIELYQVNVEKEKEGTYCIKAYWKTDETPQPYQGNYLMEITSIAGVVKSGETGKKSGTITGVALEKDTFYTLVVSVEGAKEIKDSKPLLVHTYENAKAVYDGSDLKVLWDIPDISIGEGRCFVKVDNNRSFSYKIPAGVLGMEIPMKESLYGENLVLSAFLQPFTNEYSSGPTVVLSDIYNPRYIIKKSENGVNQICYKDKSPEETSVVVPLEGEIYAVDAQGQSKRPEASVTSGPLELSVTEPYTLTIKTDTVLSRSDYDNFINSIYGLVTARAMYDILEMITRGSLHNMEDSLYFHCGLRPKSEQPQENVNQRCADVRPGFTLRLEQEFYMPKEQLSGADAAGFVGTHTAEYEVSLAQGENMEYLEFDSFISQMDEEVYPAVNNTENEMVGAGILDLSAVRMRSPYYRIQYPEAIFSSEVEPDVYVENHTLLVAEPGWKYGPLQNCILFRGRSALTLFITIVVNGSKKKVPAGTTFGKLLNLMGIFGLRQNEMQWYRRSPLGKEVKLSFQGEIVKNMPLLHGDRIEG